MIMRRAVMACGKLEKVSWSGPQSWCAINENPSNSGIKTQKKKYAVLILVVIVLTMMKNWRLIVNM